LDAPIVDAPGVLSVSTLEGQLPRLWSPNDLLLVALLSLLAAASPCWAVMPSRSGEVPPVVADGFARGLFRLPDSPALGTSAATGVWKVPVILIDWSDQPLTYASTSEWQHTLFDTTGATPTGSVFDYYRWVSGNRLRVVGEIVAVVRMLQPKNYYANNSWGLSSILPQNSAGAAWEAIARSHTQVNWSEFDRDFDGYVDMVWILHSGMGGENTVARDNLWSITSRLSDWTGGSAFVTDDLVPGTSMRERVDAFSILPELSAFRPGMRSEIGVFCHEFGHALGLPDLYDTAPTSRLFNVGPGNWSLMSTGTYGADGMSPEYPAHMGAWPVMFLGWKQPSRPEHDTLLTLSPLERGGDVVELWFQGAAHHEHFLIENRQREGFDRNLLQEGLILYQVDEIAMRQGLPSNRVNIGLYPALRIIEGDGRQDLMAGLNRADASDPLPGLSRLVQWGDATTPNSRSILGNVTHVGVEEVELAGDDVRFLARVRAPGWQPARSLTGSGYQPVLPNGPGPRAALLPGDGIAAVTSEIVQGRPQVVFRERWSDGTWEPPLPISHSSSSAFEPTVAVIPGGDVCVVWSDSRHGAHELYFRSRIQGVWTPELRLTELPGTSRAPSLGADGRGGLHLAWLYNDAQGSRVHFMYFTYASPFGDPIPISEPGRVPEPPVVAVGSNGTSYVLWPERAGSPVSLWFARFSPDTGLRSPNRLVAPQSGTLPAIHAVVTGGHLHVAWTLSSTGGSELRYMQVGTGIDTALVRRGEPILNLVLAPGRDGRFHIVMEAAQSGGSRILYKEWRPNGGWDVGDTEVTLQGDGVAARPTVLPIRQGVTVLYTGYPGGVASYMERDRDLVAAVTAVPEHLHAPSLWRARPNPLRAGQTLVLTGEGAPVSPVFELFDLAGRVVARTPLVPSQGGWRAEIGGGETRGWRSGVYFARFPGGRVQARIVVLR
jgi:M6 family metalloprotease-like protein